MDDEFSARLGAEPDDVYLQNLRRPEFEWMSQQFVEPLLALNRAQTIALFEADLLDRESAVALLDALDRVESEGLDTAGGHEAFEDPYFLLEDRISELAGEEAGGQLHTGRSRNDLFAAVVRFVVRDRLLDVHEASLDLRAALQERAEESLDVVMPAFTHSQPAQPITLGHYLAGFDHVIERDGNRLCEAYETANRSPLGAAAVAGTGFDLDRERLAELSGFDGLCTNTYDAVASMDYVPEATNALALLMTNVSRLSRDLIDWATYQFGYVELDDSMATVSSIMPQKKNPVVLEKTRTEASNTIGAANSALVHLKGAPYGDVREVAKYVFLPFFEHSTEVVRSLRLLTAVVDTMTVNEERMLEDATESFCTTTELADTLVREADLTFRQAHTVVARLVRDATEAGKSAVDIDRDDLAAAARETLDRPVDLSSEALAAALDPETNVQRRAVVGGTAPEQTRADLGRLSDGLDEQRTWYQHALDRLAEADRRRREWADEIV